MKEIDILELVSSIACGGSLKEVTKEHTARIWDPRPGTQETVYNCTADVIGYGGQAGGGKTDTLFGISHYKHKKSICFRAEKSQMDNQIVARGMELFVPDSARWVGQHKMTWHFHKGGQLTLGALKNQGDFNRYQGSSWDAMFFDEAPNMRQSEVLSVMGWNRSDDTNQKCQAYFYFNPPTTAEGNWIIEFFAPWIDSTHDNPAEEGEVRWFVTAEGRSLEVPNGDHYYHKGQKLLPRSRTFFKSRLDENPTFGEEYRSILNSLPFPLNQQLLHGDFDVGGEDNAWQLYAGHILDNAFDRWQEREVTPMDLSAIGVDIARGGRGRTILAKRYNDWIAPLVEIPYEEAHTGREVAEVVMEHIKGSKATINIDAIGYGSSPYDYLVEMGANIHGINFGNKSDFVERNGFYPMANFRSELFWQFREMMEFGDPSYISLPKTDSGLRRELATIQFSAPHGKILLEDKDKIIARIGTSTDKADAVVLACMGRYYR